MVLVNGTNAEEEETHEKPSFMKYMDEEDNQIPPAPQDNSVPSIPNSDKEQRLEELEKQYNKDLQLLRERYDLMKQKILES